MLLVLGLLGCHPDATPADTAVDPSPYIYDDEDPPVPTATPEEVGAAIQDALDRVVLVDATPVFAAYDAAMQGQSDTCPAYYYDQGNSYWFDDCGTEAGSYFSGYGYTIDYQDYPDPYDGYIYNGRGLYLASTITAGDGTAFSGAGSAYAVTADLGAEHYTEALVQGTFSWDGPGIDGTWMDEGLSPNVYLLRYTNDDYVGQYVNLDGGLSPFDGRFVAVAFDAVEMMDAGFGNTCPQEPSGSISVRGDDGWYDVVFDGSTQMPVDPAVCDGCGTAYFEGVAMGSVCPDFSALLPPPDDGGGQ